MAPPLHAVWGSVVGSSALRSRRAVEGQQGKGIDPRSSGRRWVRYSLAVSFLLLNVAGLWTVAWQHHRGIESLGNNLERTYHRMVLQGVQFSVSSRHRGGMKSSTTAYQAVPDYARKRFYCKGKGGKVAEYMKTLGWTRTRDIREAELLWYHSASTIKWSKLKRWQRVSHVTNEREIHDKGTMLDHLMPKAGFPDFDFVPSTYRLWVESERAQFFRSRQEEAKEDGFESVWDRFSRSFFRQTKGKNIGLWAVKIPNKDGGEGVSLLSTEEGLEELRQTSTSEKRVVQKYINNPLLTVDGNKLDLRVYWMIASTSPPIVFLRRDVTMRISTSEYQPGTLDLTNEQQQNAKEDWDDLRESSRGTSAHLEALIGTKFPHLFDGGGDPIRSINCQIQKAVAEVFARSCHFLGADSPTDNGFALMGADFLIDSNLNVWLIEVQSGPGLPSSSAVAERTSREIISETLNVALEIAEKQRMGAPIFPLKSVRDFQLIIDGTGAAEEIQDDGGALLSEGSILPSCSGGVIGDGIFMR